MHRASRIPLLVVAAALGLVAASALAGTAVAVGKVAAITVDGDLADWKGVPVQYLESGPRITAVARDDRFLYVHFRFSDLGLARRVLRSGAIVWFDGVGTHATGFGLRYRGTEAAQQALREMEGAAGDVRLAGPGSGPPPGGGSGDRPRLERAPLGALEVLRDGAVDEVIASGSAPDGPAAACRVADGVFAYEFRVPLTALAPRAGSAKPNPARTIAVGFQMGGLLQAEGEAMRERSGRSGPPSGEGAPRGGSPGGFGGGRGGMGGPPDGGGRGGSFGGGMRDNGPVWLDLELAAGAAAPPAQH